MTSRIDGKQTSKVLQKLYLAQCSLGQNLLAEDIGDFLDSDALSSLVIRCSANSMTNESFRQLKSCYSTLHNIFRLKHYDLRKS